MAQPDRFNPTPVEAVNRHAELHNPTLTRQAALSLVVGLEYRRLLPATNLPTAGVRRCYAVDPVFPGSMALFASLVPVPAWMPRTVLACRQ